MWRAVTRLLLFLRKPAGGSERVPSRLTRQQIAEMQQTASQELYSNLMRYQASQPLWPFLVANAAGFYTGIVAAAIVEQRYKEAYWDEHPGEAVPTMRPFLYFGKYRIRREDFE